MTATTTEYTMTAQAPALYLALELSESSWVLAFSTAPAEPPRRRTVTARNLAALDREIARAKCRFRLDADAPVRSCYEAGRDGFWIARALAARGVENLVVDPASIEVPRRQRRAKTDRLDAQKLLSQLLRYHGGETKVFHVCRVPDDSDEDRRQLHREMETVKALRTEYSNRIKGLLATRGLSIVGVGASFLAELDRLRDWAGQPVPAELRARLEREFERWQLADRQARQLETERRNRLRTAPEGKGVLEPVRRLLRLRGVGTNGSWLLVMEVFGWRKIRNRRELAALSGLVPSPYNSGTTTREQGISKAGNRRLRALLVELAWCWVRYQPDSALTQWFKTRFGAGGRRGRKVGIVALARKLLIAFWRYLDQGELPAGAKEVDWRTKLNRNAEVSRAG
jgi:transposase